MALTGIGVGVVESEVPRRTLLRLSGPVLTRGLVGPVWAAVIKV